MSEMKVFQEYLGIADQLISVASKEELAECARLLAIILANHEIKFGELPIDQSLAALNADTPDHEQLTMLNKGMENFVGLLGNIVQGLDERTAH